MNKINLKWARHDRENSFNFGDDLNPYMIEKLSGQKVNYVRFANTRINVFKEFISLLIKGNVNFKIFKQFVQSIFIKNYIIAIGSILQWYSSSRCIVWGSGIIEQNALIRNSKFLAVRGKYTKNRIQELGFIAPEVLGDPALLLPLIYQPSNQKKYRFGIIPHVNHFHHFKSDFLPENVLLIDLNSNNIENIIEMISSCEKIISTSLHGLIVAHAYKIDALWFYIENQPLHGDNIKFYDYFSSLSIPAYEPLKLEINKIFDIKFVTKLFENNFECNKSRKDLRMVQNSLLEVAPFRVRDKFMKF